MQFPRSIIYIFVFIIIIGLFSYLGAYDYILKDDFYKGMFTSLASAILLTLIIFLALRPRVSIAPAIAKRMDKSGEEFFTFKFINTSLFAAFDVHIEAYVCYETAAVDNGRGLNVSTKKVPLRRSKWIHLSSWKVVRDKTLHAPHCVKVSTVIGELENKSYVKNLDKEIDNNSHYIELRVTLKHAFSNLSSTYRKRYSTVKCIKKGDFEFGNSFKIV